MVQPVKKAKKNDGAAAPKAAAKSEADTTNGSKTVFCKNLPWGATDEDLSGFFADCGDVTDCRIGMQHPALCFSSASPHVHRPSLRLPAKRLHILQRLRLYPVTGIALEYQASCCVCMLSCLAWLAMKLEHSLLPPTSMLFLQLRVPGGCALCFAC